MNGYPLTFIGWGAAAAQWIRLCLPSYRPGFESQAHHLRFFIKKHSLVIRPVTVVAPPQVQTDGFECRPISNQMK